MLLPLRETKMMLVWLKGPQFVKQGGFVDLWKKRRLKDPIVAVHTDLRVWFHTKYIVDRLSW